MEKQFNRVELLKALELAKFGLADKEIIQQSMSFVFDGDRIYTYNDNIAVCVPFKTGMKLAVPSTPLLTLLRKVKKDDIVLSFEEGTLTVRQGKRVAAGITANEDIILPFDEKIKPPEKMKKLGCTAEAFAEGVKFCQFCICDDTQKLQLCGVHIGSDSTGTYIESTDRYRMTRKYISDSTAPINLNIPIEAAKALVNLKPVTCGEFEGWLYFKCENDVLFACYTPDEAYPDLQTQFDTATKEGKSKKVELPAKVFTILDLATQFSLQSSARDSRLKLETSNKKLTVSTTGLYGTFKESCKLDTDDKISFVLHPKALADILNISLKLSISESYIFTKGKGYWHLATLDVDDGTETVEQEGEAEDGE